MRALFFCLPACTEEVEGFINSLKNNKAPRIDGISSWLLKKIKRQISPVLAHLFNTSFETGISPEVLKIAVVIPIPLLSNFSKSILKVFEKRFMHFVISNKILSQNQFGFLRGRSTEHALLNYNISI